MNSQEIFELDKKYVAQTYGRQPLAIARGKNDIVWDLEGKRYIDCFAGLAVCNLGHAHPKIAKALAAQSKKLVHCSNLYYTQEQAELAEALSKITPNGLDKFFFCNSGTEAVEAAIKLAKRHTGKKGFIAMKGAFHGRTHGALSATWTEKYRKPFEPLLPDFTFVEYGNIAEAEKAITENTAAIIVEPVQGEGGVRIPPEGYLAALRKLCYEKKILLIFDEVQTGMGRTGKFFASQLFGVTPDIMTIAKGLGNGFPIGAIAAKSEVMASFQKGDHASTFGGNPLACAVAKTVIEVMLSEKIPEQAAEKGEWFRSKLKKIKSPLVKEVRGVGLMVALEVATHEIGEKIVSKARERGVLLNLTADTTIRFVPPLTIKRSNLSKVVKTIKEILNEEK